MKKILIYLLMMVLLSCVSSSQVVKEDVLYKTKTYVGYYLEKSPMRADYVNILTSYGIFTIKDNPEIPDSSWCYIRMESPSYDFHPDIEYQMSPKYFTWAGSEKEYRVYNDADLKKFFDKRYNIEE